MDYIVDGSELTINRIEELMSSGGKISLSENAKEAILKCRNYLDDRMSQEGEVHYGINTGFGSLCNTVISNEDLSKLQSNLVKSHACGMGEEINPKITKLMLLLKVQGLSYGHSGCQLETVERLVDFYNNDIIPVVYQQGSLGASGDLAPLAHMSLPLIGEGEVYYKGEKRNSIDVLNELGWSPIQLKSKEGLALLNGTQFMSAHGVYLSIEALKYFGALNLVAAISIEAYDARINPFNANVNEIRNQQGQITVAKVFRDILSGSEIISREKAHVQDPYSFRCIPQVHGASLDAIERAITIFQREINAVTDNPTIFPDTGEIVSAGNFHGQPLALQLDALSIAIHELASISERRIYKLISGTRGLPDFLVAHPGLNSGFMIPQYTAASIVSQNKHLANPASTDTIDSSNGQEDHVSMGANAATKCYRLMENAWSVLGIELLNAAQAFEFRRPLKSSDTIENLIEKYREVVPFVEDDVYLHPLMKASIKFLRTNEL